MNELNVSVERLTRDMRKAAATLSDNEARFLVDAYYQMQRDRIRADLRIQGLERAESNEPHSVLSWLMSQSDTLENQIKGALDRYSMAHPVGAWARSVKGIGPVIAAGYLARIDIKAHHMQTVGGMWAHCGQAPGKDRKTKGEKLGYDPVLKRLTWIVGEQFKKLSSDDPDAFYRHIYDARKKYELAKNEAGDYADQAAHALTVKRFGDDTKAKAAYLTGKLPLGHIDRRAARYAAKMFLSSLHEVWWKHEFGTDPVKPYPLPYAIAHLGHAKKIDPPMPKG